MRLPRLFATLSLLVAALTAAESAAAAPRSGFVVYKDMRMGAVTELRDASTGRVFAREASTSAHFMRARRTSECRDSHHTGVGARWKKFEPYLVNHASAPSYLDSAAALAVLRSAHSAWSHPFVTDCRRPRGKSKYRAIFGGPTGVEPSLATLEFDDLNSVGFRRLEGTFCEGPGVVACVIAYSERGAFVEADMIVESDLATQLGGDYAWTTGDTTAADGEGGELALIDVATHEFGHWAGLGHVAKSPALTMFPSVHDGMQTLGLGDMKGLLARY